MEKKLKEAVENYQCSGCANGGDISCFKKQNYGSGCGSHFAGTRVSFIGKIFLGMPKPFMRLGEFADMRPNIFKSFTGKEYDKWNIPVWKYKDEHGHTLVRGLKPRVNEPFIHVFLEDCIDKIDCYQLSKEDIENMD